MAFTSALITRLTLALWSEPEESDPEPLLHLLRTQRDRFGELTGFVSICTPDTVIPNGRTLRAMGELTKQIHAIAPFGFSVIEGDGWTQTLLRGIHVAIFTATGNVRRIRVGRTISDAFVFLAGPLGVPEATWRLEARAHSMLASRPRALKKDRAARDDLSSADVDIGDSGTADELSRKLDTTTENLAIRFGLTRAERDVYRLLALGLSTSQIARKLCISVETVRSHVKQVFAKLGVHSRSEAIVLALK
jgi:DNA-binding CsgD family transcriptional regulator